MVATRLRIYGCRLALGLCLTLCTTLSRAEERVQALRYGVTLFHYYQQDYFDALTELMAAQQLEQLAPHADNAELLRGGISLSYGMDNVAEQIFQQLLGSSNEAADRNQAWFYLGKITWQRGQLDRAAAALGQVSNDYQGALRDETDYLRAAVSLGQGDELYAATLMEQLPEDSPWRYYLAYNLGATEAARGEWMGAVAYFRPLDVLQGGTGESKALRDKALTASGYALMAVGKYGEAGGEFTRVRLDSPMSDRALLGYGWASLEMGDYLAALSPWQVLGERSLLSESVRESLLALPYAYEKLGKHGAALAGYQSAAALYEAELQRVQAATEVFRAADLPPLLGLTDDDEGQQWLFGGDILPLGEHTPYLSHLLTRHNFQLAMRELRDLYNMAWHLRDATQRLAVLEQVDGDQQQSWAGIVNGDRQALLHKRQQVLQERLITLREKFNKAQSGNDSRAFATPAQIGRWRRLEHATELANSLDATAAQRELLELCRGLLIWQDDEDFPAQSWQAKGQLQELERLVALSEDGITRVDGAVGQRHQGGFAPRIDTLTAQVSDQSQRVQNTILRSEKQLRQLAVAELETQAQRLVAGIGQSRLAVARLYDLASPEVPR